MDTFFLSAVSSFIVTVLLLISTATVTGKVVTVHVGRFFSIRAVQSVFLFIAASFAALVLVILILIIYSRAQPAEGLIYSWREFFSGRPFYGVILGILFGTLFAFWLRDLILLKQDQSVGRKLVVEAVVLAVLLAFGAFSDILASYANRISQFSLGGAQFSFSPQREAEQRGQKDLAAQSARQADKGASTQALGLIIRLARRVRDDRTYIEEVFPVDKRFDLRARQENDREAQFYDDSFGSLADCLDGLARVSADETVIDQQLRLILPPLREVVITRKKLPPERHGLMVDLLAQISKTLTDHLRNTYIQLDVTDGRRVEIESACKRYVVQACALPLERKPSDPEPEIAALLPECREMTAARKEQILDQLTKLLVDSTFQRPYMTLLYAGVLWRLGLYSTAANELHAWLRAAEQSSDVHSWYRLRARISLGGILEEWIRASNAPPSDALMEYHLDNLGKTISGMGSLLGAVIEAVGDIDEDLERDGYRGRLPLAGHKCVNLSQAKIALLVSWFSQHAVYIYRAIQSPDYYEKHSADVMRLRRVLLKKDLLCVKEKYPIQKDLVNDTYAEILEAYAEVEIANAKMIQSIGDTEAVKRRLERAKDAAKIGRQLIGPDAEESRNKANTASSFVARIEAAKAREMESKFRSIERRVDEKLRSL